jgi:carboxyl-terminal processing protease
MRVLKEKNKNRIIVPVLTVIVVLLVFSLGFVFGRSGFNAAWENGEFTYSFKGSLYPEEKEINFDLFWDVWSKLEETYVDKALDEEEMFYGAIKGMVTSLDDPATRFYTADDTQEYETQRSGKFEGIGIEMGYLDGRIIIKRVFDNSPALTSGLEAGDIITKVDNENILEFSISEVAQKIRGESDTIVVLTVERNGGDLDFDITRGEVYVKSIDWEMLDNEIALITVRRFTEDTFSNFTYLWDEVIAEVSKQNPSELIIDLRGNGGGYLDGASYLAGEFLNEGEVVLYVQNREGKKEAQKVGRTGVFKDISLVLLVDSGTASSAEIFAGALQHYERATIIGEETYGKGTAQDVDKPMTWGGASIHITTQKWLLPNQRWINQDDPIHPDIEVDVSIEEIKKGEDPQLERAIEELENR